MKKILLLTMCLVGGLMAADPILPTDTDQDRAATPASPSSSIATNITRSNSHFAGTAASKAYEADFTGWPRERLDDSIAFAKLKEQFPGLAGKIWNTALPESQTLSTAAISDKELASIIDTQITCRKRIFAIVGTGNYYSSHELPLTFEASRMVRLIQDVPSTAIINLETVENSKEDIYSVWDKVSRTKLASFGTRSHETDRSKQIIYFYRDTNLMEALAKSPYFSQTDHKGR